MKNLVLWYEKQILEALDKKNNKRIKKILFEIKKNNHTKKLIKELFDLKKYKIILFLLKNNLEYTNEIAKSIIDLYKKIDFKFCEENIFIEILKIYIGQFYDINFIDENKNTLLLLAVKNNQKKIVEFLLSYNFKFLSFDNFHYLKKLYFNFLKNFFLLGLIILVIMFFVNKDDFYSFISFLFYTVLPFFIIYRIIPFFFMRIILIFFSKRNIKVNESIQRFYLPLKINYNLRNKSKRNAFLIATENLEMLKLFLINKGYQ